MALFIAVTSCKKDDPIPAPELTSFTPEYAKRGETVSITGLNFTENTTVKINGFDAVVASFTSTTITATIPSNATPGAVSVHQGDQEDSGDDIFIYTPATDLFYTYWDNEEVAAINLASPNTSAVLFNKTDDGINSPQGIALDGKGYVYFTAETGSTIYKGKIDGTGTAEVLYNEADGLDTPNGIAIDQTTGLLYWSNSGTSQVMRGDIDGTATPVALYEGQAVLDYSYGMQVDPVNGKLYFCDFDGFIKVGNLDGTGTPAILYDNSNSDYITYPSNIFIDYRRGKIYWADEGDDNIVEANLDGSGDDVVLFGAADGVDRADGVSVDFASGKVYWSETTNDVIARGNLDGTGEKETLLSNTESYGIVLKFEE